MRHPFRMMRWTVVVGLAFVNAVPALANNFYSGGTVGTNETGWWATTDNGVFLWPTASWTVIQRSLTAASALAVGQAVDQDYAVNVTSLNISTYASSGCGTTWAKVCVYDDFYGDSQFWGWNACYTGDDGDHPNMYCDIQHIRLNLDRFDEVPNLAGLACHELGHSLGLNHYTFWEGAGCMEDPPGNRWLTGHDLDHLNTEY